MIISVETARVHYIQNISPAVLRELLFALPGGITWVDPDPDEYVACLVAAGWVDA